MFKIAYLPVSHGYSYIKLSILATRTVYIVLVVLINSSLQAIHELPTTSFYVICFHFMNYLVYP
ncbi:hypothetical protein F4823DRAFT_575904 [Ustulina deusta]|nr:hypothetical protein F4823DRAFT_575904 [Ustulina deusta]